MKNLKFILLFCFSLLLFSCYEDVKQVENPKEETNVFIQDLPKDTVLVSFYKKDFYVFENDSIGLLKYHFEQTDEDAISIWNGSFAIIIGWCVASLYIIIILLFDRKK